MSKYTDFINKFVSKPRENTWFIAALTDEYILDNVKKLNDLLSDKEGKVLEIREFNKDKEYKLFRPQIDTEFRERISENKGEFYDEIQYLDIDTKASSGKVTVTTGGGKYNLPLHNKNNARIKIRYYIDKYETTGQARVSDWRIVELMEGR